MSGSFASSDAAFEKASCTWAGCKMGVDIRITRPFFNKSKIAGIGRCFGEADNLIQPFSFRVSATRPSRRDLTSSILSGRAVILARTLTVLFAMDHLLWTNCSKYRPDESMAAHSLTPISPAKYSVPDIQSIHISGTRNHDRPDRSLFMIAHTWPYPAQSPARLPVKSTYF